MPQYKHSLIYLKPNYRLQESCLTLVSHSSLSQEFAYSLILSFVPLYSSAFLVFARLREVLQFRDLAISSETIGTLTN
ncbi:hypothetical protein [Leptospira kirschneri]|uniref:hypothetical protein n=1 Tax=Leptospira kirschneri TaxID=29507 RepID=UPI0012FD3B83|nr:hypothetical protein [Leptospira kirschneri]